MRLEELVEDNTEMAGQLREIAMTGPLDPEEFQSLKESARLVLEENQLLREAEAEARQRLERSQVGFLFLIENCQSCRTGNQRWKLRRSLSWLRRSLLLIGFKIQDSRSQTKGSKKRSVKVVQLLS